MKKIMNYVPRIFWPKEIKRCGNCMDNNDRCHIKEIQNPCELWRPLPRLAGRAKLIKVEDLEDLQ